MREMLDRFAPLGAEASEAMIKDVDNVRMAGEKGYRKITDVSDKTASFLRDQLIKSEHIMAEGKAKGLQVLGETSDKIRTGLEQVKAVSQENKGKAQVEARSISAVLQQALGNLRMGRVQMEKAADTAKIAQDNGQEMMADVSRADSGAISALERELKQQLKRTKMDSRNAIRDVAKALDVVIKDGAKEGKAKADVVKNLLRELKREKGEADRNSDGRLAELERVLGAIQKKLQYEKDGASKAEDDWAATEASTKQSVEDMKEEAAEARQSLAGKIRRDLAEATGSAMKEAQDNTNEAAAKGQEAIRAMSSNFARAQEQEASSKAKAEGDVKKAMGAAEMQVLEAEKNAEKVKESLGQKPDLSQADAAIREMAKSESQTATAIGDVDALFADEEAKRKAQFELAEGQSDDAWQSSVEASEARLASALAAQDKEGQRVAAEFEAGSEAAQKAGKEAEGEARSVVMEANRGEREVAAGAAHDKAVVSSAEGRLEQEFREQENRLQSAAEKERQEKERMDGLTRGIDRDVAGAEGKVLAEEGALGHELDQVLSTLDPGADIEHGKMVMNRLKKVAGDL